MKRAGTNRIFVAVLVFAAIAGVSVLLMWTGFTRARRAQDTPEPPFTAEQSPAQQPIVAAGDPGEFADYEPRPLPADMSEGLDRDLVAPRLAFYRRIYVGLYRDYGSHDPSWDGPAEKLLDGWARMNANVDLPTQEELVALAEELAASDCDDPLVERTVGSALFWGGQVEKARERMFALHRAEEAGTLAYPPVILWQASSDLAYLLDSDPSASDSTASEMRAEAAHRVAEGLDDVELSDEELRFFAEWVDMAATELSPEQRAAYADQLRLAAKPDEGEGVSWLRDLLEGTVRIDSAWDARGAAPGREVSDEQWEIFFERLGVARERLTVAHRLRRQFPEAATGMITVAMGENASLQERRMWFDRAVAAQLDYFPAYSEYLWALRPRWGGTHQAMYAVGVECLETGRFDTIVPQVLVKAVIDIGEDEANAGVYADPKVYDACTSVFEGYQAEEASPYTPVEVKTMWAGIAWRCGDDETALALLDDLGGDVDAQWLKQRLGDGAAAIRRDIAEREGE